MVSAHVSAPFVFVGSKHDIYTYLVLLLQACSNVTLKDVAVLGECCPPGRDSSLNLMVLVFVLGVVSLSQVDVAFNFLDLSVVDIILNY